MSPFFKDNINQILTYKMDQLLGAGSPKVNLGVLDRRERVKLIELFELAEKLGWDFKQPNSLIVLDFIDAIRQAGVDGKLQFYGRPFKPNDFVSTVMNKPLTLITKVQWQHYTLDYPSVFELDLMAHIVKIKEDNIETLVYSSSDNKNLRFSDIYVSNTKLKKWVRSAKADFYERRLKQEKSA